VPDVQVLVGDELPKLHRLRGLLGRAVIAFGLSEQSVVTIELVFQLLVKVDALRQAVLLLLITTPVLAPLAATSRLTLIVRQSRGPCILGGLRHFLRHPHDALPLAWPFIHHRHLRASLRGLGVAEARHGLCKIGHLDDLGVLAVVVWDVHDAIWLE